MPNIGITDEDYKRMNDRRDEFKKSTSGGNLPYAAIVTQGLDALEQTEKMAEAQNKAERKFNA